MRHALHRSLRTWTGTLRGDYVPQPQRTRQVCQRQLTNPPLRIFSTSRVLGDLINMGLRRNMLQYGMCMAMCDCHSLRRINLIRVQAEDWASKISDRILVSCPSFITTNKITAIFAFTNMGYPCRRFPQSCREKHRSNVQHRFLPYPFQLIVH
jgi:hypothetical protein